jgi:GT2 family glycosyltransferase/glycosyltransferase involved in cell wall biosynthesis
MQGGGDAYVFFRAARLTEGDAAGRTVLPAGAGAIAGDSARLAVVPFGDALSEGARPIAIDDGRVRLDLPDLPAPERIVTAVSISCDGAVLEISGAGDPDTGAHDLAVVVAVDGVLTATTTLTRAGDGFAGRLRLDASLLDGGEHWVELLGENVGEVLAAAAVRFPAAQTPPEILRHVTSRIDRPGALPFAEERYQALTATLERLAAARADPEILAEVMAAHALVMRGPDPDARHHAPRAFPLVETPRFSVVIPVHDQYHFTHFCLGAVLLTCAGLPVEVIVVDDGSTDRTAHLEEIWSGVRVVRHAKAQGFVRACNAGAAIARGDHLVFLNNDTEPTGRWLDELHLPFLAFADVGMTGAKLVYPDGKLQDAGNIVWNNGRPWNLGRGGNRADPGLNYTRPSDYLSGAAFMIPRATWNAVGGFSPEFEPAYYEDTDLAFKVRAQGLRTLYAAKATVIHYEGVSNGLDLASGLKRFQATNRPKFEAKWRGAFRSFAAEGTSPDREKDRAAIGRALVLDYQVPRFDMDAGSLAISQEIRLLQSLGYKIVLAPRNMAHLGLYTETFERGGVEHLHAPFHGSLAEIVERRGAEFDLVYIHRWSTAQGLLPLIRRHAPQARILLNVADLHFLRELRAARVAGSEEALAAAHRSRDAELAVLEEVDAILTYSEIEQAVIESLLGLEAPVHLLPWVAPTHPAPPPLTDRADIGFLGSFDHTPNRDAVRFFLAEVWPALRERHPGVRFRIAGSGFERFQLPKEDAKVDGRVDIVGWVPDAQAFLGSCRVAVAPLLAGAGVKGKVVDALLAGTPGVLSPVAAEGLHLQDSPAAPVARTPAEWIAATSRLLDDDDAWQTASRAAATAAARFGFDAGVARFARILQSAGLPFDPPGAEGPRPLYPLVSYDRLWTLSRFAASA